MDTLKYPIGTFDFSKTITDGEIPDLIHQIEVQPVLLHRVIEEISKEKLDSSYRPGGWTLRQVIHHIADSHMNSYIRFKLALTEDCPTIKPFDEEKWAELDDAAHMPVEVSIQLIEALHQRWVWLLRSLDSAQLDARFHHPVNGDVSLRTAVALYAWHGNHHLAHIRSVQ